MTSELRIKTWLNAEHPIESGDVVPYIAELANVEAYNEARHGNIANYLFDCQQVVLDKLFKIFGRNNLTIPNAENHSSDAAIFFDNLQNIFNEYYLQQDEKHKLVLLRSPRTKLAMGSLLKKGLQTNYVDVTELFSAMDNAQKTVEPGEAQVARDALRTVGNDKHRVDQLVLAAKAIVRLILDSQKTATASCGIESRRFGPAAVC